MTDHYSFSYTGSSDNETQNINRSISGEEMVLREVLLSLVLFLQNCGFGVDELVTRSTLSNDKVVEHSSEDE